MSLSPGTRVGPYEILSPLGAGGMGEVYRARDPRLDRDVALKILSEKLADDPAMLARFEREAKAVAALSHPNIVAIHDFSKDQKVWYAVTECLEGETLRARLARGPLEWKVAVEIALEIAAGLTAAHDRGIVHRDLKPDNVFLTRDGRVKILDFGLARSHVVPAGGDATTSLLSVPGRILGTYGYMSPEQLRGETADPRSDIFSFGCLLYELIAGRRPFAGDSAPELIAAVLKDDPLPMPSNLSAPEAVEDLIVRCLAKRPDERFQTVRDLNYALRNLLKKDPTPRMREESAAIVESIVVLPFENLSGPDQEYFVAGMHDAVIGELAQIRAVRVISRTSAMRYKNSNKSVPEIARELNVAGVVEGSVFRVGNNVRIQSQLIGVFPDEHHICANTYDAELGDILTLHAEVARAIAREIKVRVTPDEEKRLGAKRRVNPETYEAYLKGMFHVNQFTPEGFEKGIGYFRSAIEKDPTDPLPYAGLALALCVIGHAVDERVLVSAKPPALRAVQLDENLAEAHEALAEVVLYRDWDWDAAETQFQRVFDLNPSLAMAHAHYAWFMALKGESDDAVLTRMRRACELDPLMPLYPCWLAWIEWAIGRDDEALINAQKSVELNPSFPPGLYILGAVYAERGRYGEAIAAQEKAGAISPGWRTPLARTYAQAGRIDDARALIAAIEEKATGMDAYFLAQACIILGDTEQALRWIEFSYEKRWSWIPWIGRERAYAPLYDHPHFKSILARLRLPYLIRS